MKNLVIVESPSKTKKLSGFLGKDYKVVSSVGHIRDLPKSGIGVDTEKNFEPEYVVTPEKIQVVKDIKNDAKESDAIYLATDPDREGEAISWHVGFLINSDTPLHDSGQPDYLEANKIRGKAGKNIKVYRVTFNAITKEAVLDGFAHPRKLDFNLIDAQQARRVLDRLVGYKLSPLLWEKIRYGLSAGRVQSVAVRFVVERENEIQNFAKDNYYEFAGEFKPATSSTISAKLSKIDGKQFYLQKRFKLFAGDYTCALTSADTKEKANEIEKAVKSSKFEISDVVKKSIKSFSSPPFTTSTLQQSASSRMGLSPKRTMQIAQKLYEDGYITYMRTDSVSMDPEFVSDMRKSIKSWYGDKYLLAQERFFKGKNSSKVKTQEAHEAIRPTNVTVTAANLPKSVQAQSRKLYDLIYTRTLATQMTPAVYANTTIVVKNEVGGKTKAVIKTSGDVDSKVETPTSKSTHEYEFHAKGSILEFDGFLRVYKSSKKDQDLPDVKVGDKADLKKLETIESMLTPPPRYNESSLVKELERFGIGRPSTYAPIISTIQARGYVRKDGKALYPTDNGVVVNNLLVEHFEQIVDVEFTADMEGNLDEVAAGKENWRDIIRDFYEPFEKLLKVKRKEIKKEDIVILEKTDEKCPECKKGNLIVKLGKFGKFLSCDRYPDCKYAKPIEVENVSGEENPEQDQINKELEELTKKPCPECGGKLIIKDGRFGKFVACENYPKCKHTESVQAKLNIKCPKCGKEHKGEVIVRRTKRGKVFYGCSRYPDCDFASWKKPGSADKIDEPSD